MFDPFMGLAMSFRKIALKCEQCGGNTYVQEGHLQKTESSTLPCHWCNATITAPSRRELYAKEAIELTKQNIHDFLVAIKQGIQRVFIIRSGPSSDHDHINALGTFLSMTLKKTLVDGDIEDLDNVSKSIIVFTKCLDPSSVEALQKIEKTLVTNAQRENLILINTTIDFENVIQNLIDHFIDIVFSPLQDDNFKAVRFFSKETKLYGGVWQINPETNRLYTLEELEERIQTKKRREEE